MRANYLHLIIDRSVENGFAGPLEEAETLVRKQFPDIEEVRVTLANFNVVPLADGESIDKLPIAGGFDLDKALAQSIAQHTLTELDHAATALPPEPIFVIVSRAGLHALPELGATRIWSSHLSQLEIHSVARGGQHTRLTGETTHRRPLIKVGQAIRPANSGRSLIFPVSEQAPEYYDATSASWEPLAHVRQASDSPWGQAIALWVDNHRYAASPGSAEIPLQTLVAESRRSGILIPATSYIVVENEAQWRILEKKEAQKLEQNEALDFLETPAPGALGIGLGFGAWLLWRRRRHFTFK